MSALNLTARTTVVKSPIEEFNSYVRQIQNTEKLVFIRNDMLREIQQRTEVAKNTLEFLDVSDSIKKTLTAKITMVLQQRDLGKRPDLSIKSLQERVIHLHHSLLKADSVMSEIEGIMNLLAFPD